MKYIELFFFCLMALLAGGMLLASVVTYSHMQTVSIFVNTLIFIGCVALVMISVNK